MRIRLWRLEIRWLGSYEAAANASGGEKNEFFELDEVPPNGGDRVVRRRVTPAVDLRH